MQSASADSRSSNETKATCRLPIDSICKALVAAIEVDVPRQVFMASTTLFSRMACCKCASKVMMPWALEMVLVWALELVAWALVMVLVWALAWVVLVLVWPLVMGPALVWLGRWVLV